MAVVLLSPLLDLSKVTGGSFPDAVTILRPSLLMVRRLNMKQLRWAFFHLRLLVLEFRLWMDGLSWEQVRIVAERLTRAAHERSELQG